MRRKITYLHERMDGMELVARLLGLGACSVGVSMSVGTRGVSIGVDGHDGLSIDECSFRGDSMYVSGRNSVACSALTFLSMVPYSLQKIGAVNNTKQKKFEN